VAAVVLVSWMIMRPVRLASVRWWRVPEVAASLRLTVEQQDAIDRLYDARLDGRRRCVERLVEASNHVDRLIRNGDYGEDMLRETSAIAGAAGDDRTLTRRLNDDIAGLLSPSQRDKLSAMRPRLTVE
jgi:hypothetical protein